MFDGQVDVPVNVRLNVQFGEPLNALELAGVSLTDAGGTAVSSNVSLSGDRRTLTVVPKQLLAANGDYTLTLDGIQDISGNTPAVAHSITFTTGDNADFTRSTITYWSIPNSNTQGVPTNAELVVGLSERIDPTTVGGNSFYLYDNTRGRRVAGSWALSTDGQTLRFSPTELLEPLHQYYFYVGYSPYLKDLAGNNIHASYRYFSTGEEDDQLAPVVTQTNFVDGSTDIPVNGRIVVLLNERLGSQCSISNAIRLTGGAGDVPVNISMASDRRTLTITPVSDLQTQTAYTLDIDGLCDYAGNQLAAYSLGFTSGINTTHDNSGPSLVSITPANNAVDVAVTSNIVMVFDEPVDQRTAPSVVGGGITVPGSYSVNGDTVIFTPSVTLKGSTTYNVNLHYNVSDMAGKNRWLGTPKFTTVAVTDEVAPAVSAISPADSDIDVHPGSSIVVTFSEPMNPSALNNSNIAFYANGSTIGANVYKSSDGQRLTLTGNLPQATVVSVVMTDALEDLSGNKLPPFVSSFTTGVVDRDNGRPSVSRQLPTNGSNNWLGVDEIVLYTSEPMNAASIPDAFHVTENGVLVDGTLEVLADGQTIRFTKATPFAEGARVQANLGSSAEDDSGNAIYAYSGYFNMGSSNDRAGDRPNVTGYYPGNNMTGVPLNPVIHVRFNEELDAALIGSADIRLQNVSNGWAHVAKSVSLDSTGHIVKITPDALLTADNRYYVYLSGVTDTDGDNSWGYSTYFYTNADSVEDNRQPTVLAISPPESESGVGVNARYSARFDESMNPLVFDSDNGQRFNAQFSENNHVMRYERLGTLPASTEVTENLPQLIDSAGNSMVAASTTFTTGNGPDFSRPDAVNTTVVNNQQDVPLNPVLEWQLSEAVDPVSVSSSGVYLYDNTDRVRVPSTFALSNDGKRLQIVPNAALEAAHQYYYYAYSLRDMSGNNMHNRYRYFTTGLAADVTAPVILESSVSSGQTNVPLNVRLNVQYDEPLNALELAGVSLTDAGGATVPSNVTLSGDRRTLTIVPKQLLVGNADYTLTVDAIQDISGNTPATAYSVTFTTEVSADFTRNSITYWSVPNNNTQDVPVNAELIVGFSDRIDPTTVNSNSFYLYDNTARQRVSGSWSLSADGRQLIFTPSALLTANRQYYFYVGYSPYLKDLAGNNIHASYRYFTTGANNDVTAPSVAQTSFADGTTDIPVNGSMHIVLDERLGGHCSLDDSIALSSAAGDEPVSITLASDRRKLTISPVGDLQTLTSYTLTLNGLCDYAGNAMAAYNLGFTSSLDANHDNIAPTVVSVIPAYNSTEVDRNTNVVMTFSEPVDLRTAPLLRENSSTVVSGSYSVSGSTVTFTPSATLSSNTQYRLDLQYDVSDFAGNTSWLGYHYFTTGN